MNTLSLAKNSHIWRWAYTLPCQKFALFVSPFTLPVSPFTERWERDRDGSDVTIVALKLAMNTLSLAKNSHNWRWAYTFPCQKFALFVSPFTLSVPPFTERSPLWRWNSQWVHTFHCQNFFARFVPPLSNGTSRTTSDRKPKTNDQILPSPILFFPSKNWIKLIPKTIGNRKRDCAWGGSGW